MGRSSSRHACNVANRAIDQASSPALVVESQDQLQDVVPVSGSHDHPLQALPSSGEQAERTTDPTHRVFQVGDPLPKRMASADMLRAFGVKRSHFANLVAQGKFDRFELLPRIGRRAWSGVLVERYLSCESGASRFVTVGGRKRA